VSIAALYTQCGVGAHRGAEPTAKGRQGTLCGLHRALQGTRCPRGAGEEDTAAQDCGSKNSKQDVFYSRIKREK